MSSNIVGCFDDPTEAHAVQRDLISAGIPRDHVHMHSERQSAEQEQQASEPGIWESIKDAFGFADDQDRTTYQEAARRGGVIVSVDAPDEAVDRAVRIMKAHNVVDLDSRAQQWRQQGWAGVQSAQQTAQPTEARQQTSRETESRSAESREAIPVVQEELRVGKRAVQQGGVRVYSHVTEQPVEEQINLRQEHVQVDRRPVDRPVTNSDQAFKERAIEATEMAEEAVVQKQARVVEEVSVRKDVQQRPETIRDTVRRTDVDVQRIPGQSASSSATIPDSYFTELSSDARYRGRDWSTIEPELRRSFEERYPGSPWEQYRDRIRSSMDRARM